MAHRKCSINVHDQCWSSGYAQAPAVFLRGLQEEGLWADTTARGSEVVQQEELEATILGVRGQGCGSSGMVKKEE